MTLNQNKYNKSESVKLKAVKEVLENGRAVADVANQIGVHRATVYNWLETYKADDTIKVTQSKFTNKPASSQLNKENKDLKKKLKEQEMEIEILKKFQAFLKGNE